MIIRLCPPYTLIPPFTSRNLTWPQKNSGGLIRFPPPPIIVQEGRCQGCTLSCVKLQQENLILKLGVETTKKQFRTSLHLILHIVSWVLSKLTRILKKSSSMMCIQWLGNKVFQLWIDKLDLTEICHIKIDVIFLTIILNRWHVIFGMVQYYAIQVEFQVRGCLHIHFFVWVLNAPFLSSMTKVEYWKGQNNHKFIIIKNLFKNIEIMSVLY